MSVREVSWYGANIFQMSRQTCWIHLLKQSSQLVWSTFRGVARYFWMDPLESRTRRYKVCAGKSGKHKWRDAHAALCCGNYTNYRILVSPFAGYTIRVKCWYSRRISVTCIYPGDLDKSKFQSILHLSRLIKFRNLSFVRLSISVL